MSEHHVDLCDAGHVVGQCRCPGPNGKVIRRAGPCKCGPNARVYDRRPLDHDAIDMRSALQRVRDIIDPPVSGHRRIKLESWAQEAVSIIDAALGGST